MVRALMALVGVVLVLTGMGLMIVGLGMPMLVVGLGLFSAALEGRTRSPAAKQ